VLAEPILQDGDNARRAVGAAFVGGLWIPASLGVFPR
jgi:hypothetical protein